MSLIDYILILGSYYIILIVQGVVCFPDDVVSPAPKVGVKYKPKDVQPSSYVERLQRASLEAPRTHRHRDAYGQYTSGGFVLVLSFPYCPCHNYSKVLNVSQSLVKLWDPGKLDRTSNIYTKGI